MSRSVADDPRWEAVREGGLALCRHQDGTWTVAEEGAWLPGIYDSRETAVVASALNWSDLCRLGPICQADGEDRPVTMDDLAGLSTA
jgi:hypothetical protein